MKVPSSGSISPVSIWKKVVAAIVLLPTKATLSSLFMTNEISSSTLTPSIVLEICSTVRTSLPISLSGLKSIYGYLRLDGFISSSCIFSRACLREVACLDFDAFALNRWMKLWSSFIFSSFFLFASFICFIINWLDSYQKS